MMDREKLAREIAEALGDDLDKAFANKSDWNAARGGDPYRDINMPFRGDYLEAVDAILQSIADQGFVIVPAEPTKEMLEAASPWPSHWSKDDRDAQVKKAAVIADQMAAASTYRDMIASHTEARGG